MINRPAKASPESFSVQVAFEIRTSEPSSAYAGFRIAATEVVTIVPSQDPRFPHAASRIVKHSPPIVEFLFA